MPVLAIYEQVTLVSEEWKPDLSQSEKSIVDGKVRD